MALGLLGKKLGMTHIYDDYGRRMAVTAVQAGPCTIVGVRTPDRHGYQAVQVGFEPLREGKGSKPVQGQFKKAGTPAFRYVREFRLPADGPAPQAADAPGTPELKVGQELTLSLFQEYELVDVVGVSIGKGFQGGMKRWNWSGGGATHGSMSHRAPGSIGSTTTPGRVIKGHHLPGHMGHDRVTVQNVRLVHLDLAHHLALLEGSVPGSEHGLIELRKSVKRPGTLKKPLAAQAVVDEEEDSKKARPAAKKK